MLLSPNRNSYCVIMLFAKTVIGFIKMLIHSVPQAQDMGSKLYEEHILSFLLMYYCNCLLTFTQ